MIQLFSFLLLIAPSISFALPRIPMALPAFTVPRNEEIYRMYESFRQADEAPIFVSFSHYDLPPNPALIAATTKFGATVIDMRALPFESQVLDTGKRPWSGWWFPKQEKAFTDEAKGLSILKKFDLYFSQTDKTSAFLKEKQFDEGSASKANWEGLCDAWAIASISEPEPQRPLTVEVTQAGKTSEVTFEVAELKGLLMKTYEAVGQDQFDVYGEKFLGNKDSWIQPDLFPDQFHRLVETYIGQKKQPFVMDRDPGIEVWNVPVFRANYKMEANPADPKSVIVRMWLHTAGPLEIDEKNFVGSKTVIFEYNYTLNGDLTPDGKLVVNSGRWIKKWKDSEANHPDYIIAPKQKFILRRSYNENIDPRKVDYLVNFSR